MAVAEIPHANSPGFACMPNTSRRGNAHALDNTRDCNAHQGDPVCVLSPARCAEHAGVKMARQGSTPRLQGSARPCCWHMERNLGVRPLHYWRSTLPYG